MLAKGFARFAVGASLLANRSARFAVASLLANPSPPFAGTISMKTREPLEERLKYIPEYLRIFTGVEPQTRELERFYSRHGVAGAS